MTTSSSELLFVKLDERVYKYIRQFTIKSSQDALIELVTNSIDAYNRGGITVDRKIDIIYHSPNIIYHIDHAIGLTSEEMVKYFLTVGQYSAEAGSRGFFSRGAKDISAIANITFTAVKGGLISQVYLNSEAYGQLLIQDQPVTESQRLEYRLPGNGLNVKLDLLPNFIVKDPSGQALSLSKLGVLRDIMVNTDNVIQYSHVNEVGVTLFSRRVYFEYPSGTKLLDVTYELPGYPDHSARFEVYVSHEPIPQPVKEDEMVFGFIIRDNTSVYEINTIDDRFRWNPYMNRVYGTLTCNGIHQMLLDYDTAGPTPTNPTPIIDPSRLTGTNKAHPYIEGLLAIPKVRLDAILRELNTSISKTSVSLQEINDLLEELERYGLNVLDDEDVRVEFVPKYDATLAKSILDDRQNYVSHEISYLMTGDYSFGETISDKFIKDKLIELEATPDQAWIEGDNGLELLNFANDAQTPLDPETILDLISDSDREKLLKNPYIYKLGPDGKLTKMYIFQRGEINKNVTPESDYLNIKTKKFSVSFINDINLQGRYNIEYTDGVNIQINLANPLVAKYMITDNVKLGNTDLSLENVKSSSSLLFMQEIMIEILSQIILESDILNSRLILDGNNLTNTKKTAYWRNSIVARIEGTLSSIFEKFITKSRDTKLTQLNTIIDIIGTRVSNLIDLSVQGGDLYTLKDDLKDNLTKLVE